VPLPLQLHCTIALPHANCHNMSRKWSLSSPLDSRPHPCQLRDAPPFYADPGPAAAGAFEQFTKQVKLSPAGLAPWEKALKRQLLSSLQSMRVPFPLLDWINYRAGDEIETIRDIHGHILIRLSDGHKRSRSGNFTAGTCNGVDNEAKRMEAFFRTLPSDSFTSLEGNLRDTIFEFLASWEDDGGATHEDLCNDRRVASVCAFLLPNFVPLMEWINRRIGEEVFFSQGHNGQNIIDVSVATRKHLQKLARTMPRKLTARGVEPKDCQSNINKRKAEEVAGETVVARVSGQRPVVKLAGLCGRLAGHFLRKGEIIYDVTQVGQQRKATVTLHCLDGEEYTGELCQTNPDARDSAALAFLQAKTEEIAALNPSTRKKMRSGFKGPFVKRVRVAIQNGYVSCEEVRLDEGKFRTAITFMEGEVFIGDVCSDADEAFRSVAQLALEHQAEYGLNVDPEFAGFAKRPEGSEDSGND